jgi:D-arabinose 1-dehydrogenase-like Zn-dependent alcohol dehydrogenase
VSYCRIVSCNQAADAFGFNPRLTGYKRMTIEGFMVGTLAEGKELMALARAGKIKPTPMKEEPMADVQKWIDELRAGKVVGRIVLKN